MSVHHRELRLATKGGGDMHDLTPAVAETVRETAYRPRLMAQRTPEAEAGEPVPAPVVRVETGSLGVTAGQV